MHTVRYWAKLRRVSGSGGRLTSYALTLLVVCYLQTVKDPLIPSIERMSQLSGALYCHAIVPCFHLCLLLVTYLADAEDNNVKRIYVKVCILTIQLSND